MIEYEGNGRSDDGEEKVLLCTMYYVEYDSRMIELESGEHAWAAWHVRAIKIDNRVLVNSTPIRGLGCTIDTIGHLQFIITAAKNRILEAVSSPQNRFVQLRTGAS